MKKFLILSVAILVTSISASGQGQGQAPSASDPLEIGGKDADWFNSQGGRVDTDSEPQAPFKIMGNVYYVGANNISSILVTTPQGHILLDTGTKKMTSVIFPNIVKLGFKPADIKIIMISHAHYDHMETLETIRRITGATVAALEAEVPALVSGRDLSQNETWGSEPVLVGRILKSGDEVSLGGTSIKVIWTGGHTPGTATYVIPAVEDGRTYQIVFGGPPGPITGNPRYDTRPEDAFAAYKALRALNPDIVIGGHPLNQFKGKLEALWKNTRPSPLMLAPGQWQKQIDDSEAGYKKRLAATTATR
jgi:metallo-beta-lactamase class B